MSVEAAQAAAQTTLTTPWWAAASLFAGALGMRAVDFMLNRKKSRTETDANIDLIETMRQGLDRQGAQIRAMQEQQDRLARRLDDEIRLRMEAQEEAHWLRLRVAVLESALRQLGAVIPEDPRPPKLPGGTPS